MKDEDKEKENDEGWVRSCHLLEGMIVPASSLSHSFHPSSFRLHLTQ
jgi:hypothetical protein